MFGISSVGQDAIAALAAIGQNQPIVEYDPNGMIRTINDAACAVLGYEAEELVGRFHTILVDVPKDRSADFAAWNRINTGQETGREALYRCRDGKLLSVKSVFSIVSLKNKPRRIIELFFAIRQPDATARQCLRTAADSVKAAANMMKEVSACVTSSVVDMRHANTQMDLLVSRYSECAPPPSSGRHVPGRKDRASNPGITPDHLKMVLDMNMIASNCTNLVGLGVKLVNGTAETLGLIAERLEEEAEPGAKPVMSHLVPASADATVPGDRRRATMDSAVPSGSTFAHADRADRGRILKFERRVTTDPEGDEPVSQKT